MTLDWALMGISTALGAAGSIAESQAQASYYSSNAEAAKHNSRVQAMNAQRESQEGAMREQAQRRAARQETGALAASLSQSGLYGGTSTGVLNQSLVNAELDALNTRYNAESRATAYRQDSLNQMAEARNMQMYAKGARNSAWGGVLNSVLGGATMAYGAGLFGGGGNALNTAMKVGGMVPGLSDPKKPGFNKKPLVHKVTGQI